MRAPRLRSTAPVTCGTGTVVAAAAAALLPLLSSAVVSVAAADCSSTSWEPNCNIYLHQLDRHDFLIAFLQFGIPCLVCLLLGGWAFWKAQFKFRLLPSVVGASDWSWLSDDRTLEKALGWLTALILLVAALPTVFILLWGIWVYQRISHLLGFAIFLMLMAVQLGAYAFAHWKVNGWRLDRLTQFLFALSVCAMWSLELWTIYLHEPYTYFNLSVVYVSFNFLPMCLLTFLVARSMTKPLGAYRLLDRDPVDDYQTYIRELQAQQKLKVDASDKGPLFMDGSMGSSGSGLLTIQLGADNKGKGGADDEERKEQVIAVQPSVPSGSGRDHVVTIHDGSLGGRATALLLEASAVLQSPVWWRVACYSLALALLLAYSLSLALAKHSDGFGNVVGWITSGTIVVLDLTVWLCVYGGKINTPLEACAYQGACRIILIMFGDVYWFIGHSVMYCVLAVFFGRSIVNHVLPQLNATAQKSSAVTDLLQQPASAAADADAAASSLSTTADRYSEQLGAGFMSHGRFSQTRIGRSLLHYIEFWAFGILTAAFLADLIVNSATSTVALELDRSHEQYIVGILAIFLTGVILSSHLILRMYANRDYRIDARLLLSCLAQWAICGGCAGFLWDRTRSVILVTMFCFMPPVLYLSCYAYREWVKNDFQMWVAAPDPALAQAKAEEDRKVNNFISPSGPHDPSSPVMPSDVDEEKQTGLPSPGATPIEPTPVTPAPAPAPGLGSSTQSFRAPRMPHLQEVNVDLGRFEWLRKYKIGAATVLAALLVVGMGSCIAANSDPPYVGYSIMAVMLILASTIIPIIEWFNSFEISKNMVVQLVVTTICFLAFVLIFWLEGLDRANDNRSLALLFVLFMYPTFVVLTFAVIKWRDDKWVMSLFVKTALVVCCALITTFLIVVAVVYDPWQIGAALLVAFMVILFGSFLVPVLTARFPWLIKWAVGVGLCVLIAFAAGVGSQDGYGFVGFSLAWGILFLCLVVAAWQAHRNVSHTAVLSHLCSPNLFPVFSYSTQAGIRNPLHPDDTRVYLVYAALVVSLVWGLLAIFFVPTTWIGLGVHAISIVLMVLYAAESVSRPRILLARAVRYLGEGSVAYEEAVHRAKLAAFRAQLSSIKATSNSPDQQLQAGSDAPTVAGSPESSRSAKGAGGDDSSSSSPKPAATAGEGGKNFLQRTLSMAAEAARSAEPEDQVLDEADLKFLGLDDPAKPLTELDWRGLYDTTVALRAATPLPNMLAFTKGAAVDVAMVSWRGQQIPRRRAHDLLLKLDHHVALLHSNYLAYQTHVQVELILAVEAIKAEHETELLTMLRDTGHAHLTVEYLRALKPNQPERVALERALVEWKRAQEQLKADRIRKRAEEEERTRLREEEERQRIREEEERVIRARQEQIKADEEAARQKQEELRARERAEQAEREEQIYRTQQAARLEAERVERERQEAERKRQEEEYAARLIAEQNERALQQLRAQQEAQRVADEIRREKERQQLEQLAAEQRARDEALAVQEALQAKVALAVRKNCCTLNETGAKFVAQQWYQCVTCTSPNSEGVCAVCVRVCHAGHQLRDMGVSPFYCDCGKSGCEAATGVKPAMKGKPTLQSIEAAYAATGQQWVDPDFAPAVSSLLRDPKGSTHPDWKELQWKRPEEMRGMSAPVLFHDGADPLDINQGNIGDCWFMSAMSVMTQRQKDFVDIFVSKEHSKAGVYSLNFWKNGERINVLIDSLFPATKTGSAAFGHSAKENELWVMILEKAYAKIHRTYEAIESGFVDQALVDLSGGLGSRIDMTKDPYKQQTRNGVLFKQLLQYREAGFLLGAGSPAGSDSEANASPSGIVQGHAYSVLDVQEVDAIQLIRLRNPWGRKEWTGDWSDHSDKWTRRLKAKLGHVERDDGAFWMSFIDFSIHFEEVYVARFFDDAWISLPIIRGEWKGATAGGCTNFDTVKDNPQFLLTVTQPNTSVVINLSQTDSRGTSQKLKPIAIEVYSNRGQRVTRTRTGPLVCSNPDSYIYRREVSVDQVMQPGKAPYTVLISTFNQKEETKYAISVYSSAPVLFEVAPPVAPTAKK